MSNLSAQPIAFGIESKTVNDRDTFTVAVSATSDLTGQGIYSFKFTLAYNTTYLEYLGIESTGSVLNTWGMPTANTPSSGRIAIAGAGAITGADTGTDTDTGAGAGADTGADTVSMCINGFTFATCPYTFCVLL